MFSFKLDVDMNNLDKFRKTVPNLLGLASMAFAALAKLLNTPPTTAAKPIDTRTINIFKTNHVHCRLRSFE